MDEYSWSSSDDECVEDDGDYEHTMNNVQNRANNDERHESLIPYMLPEENSSALQTIVADNDILVNFFDANYAENPDVEIINMNGEVVVYDSDDDDGMLTDSDEEEDDNLIGRVGSSSNTTSSSDYGLQTHQNQGSPNSESANIPIINPRRRIRNRVGVGQDFPTGSCCRKL